MIRTFAYIFAVIFIAVGLAGFMGWGMHGDKLLGIFALNSWHNWLHIASGVVAGLAGYAGGSWPKWYFKIFGILYIVFAGLGLYYGEGLMFGYIANNMADVGLHAILGVAALYLGFRCGCCCKKDKEKA